MDFKDYQVGKTDAYFWHRGRCDLLDRLLAKRCGSRTGEISKILDIGGGTGGDLEILSRYGQVYLIDIDDQALALVDDQRCAEKRQADACQLPYGDASFDLVIAFEVFEHIADDARAVAEAHRVLRPGGQLLFSVPAFQFLFSSHDQALAHQRRYSKKGLTKLLRNFREVRLNYWNVVLLAPIAVLRLVRKRAKPKVDFVDFPPLVDRLLGAILSWENRYIARGLPFPFGLSLIGLCTK